VSSVSQDSPKARILRIVPPRKSPDGMARRFRSSTI
jgi:hypothetical protein